MRWILQSWSLSLSVVVQLLVQPAQQVQSEFSCRKLLEFLWILYFLLSLLNPRIMQCLLFKLEAINSTSHAFMIGLCDIQRYNLNGNKIGLDHIHGIHLD